MICRTGLPLLVTEWAQGATIEVFTSLEGPAAAYPDLPYVTLPFPASMALLPDRVGLAIDPGGPAERELETPRWRCSCRTWPSTGRRDTDRLLELVSGAPALGRGDTGEAVEA